VANSKDGPWAQQPVLRGMSGQRVLVLMDGSPMNNVRGRGPQPSLIGAEQIERIEIVRGPASVAYGSDALGGVINIITREAGQGAAPSIGGAVSVGGSTVDSQRNAYLELVPRIGRFSAFLSSGYRKADDFDSPAGRIEDSAFEAYDALFNLRYDFTPKTALKGGLQFYRGTDIGIPGLTVDSPAFSQKFRYDDYDRDFAHLTLDHGYAGSWLAGTRMRGYWQREKRNFHSDIRIDMGPPPFPMPWPDNLLQDKDRFVDLETWGGQLQATSVKTERHQFTGGLDFARDLPGGTNEEINTFVDANGNPTSGPFGSPGVSAKTARSTATRDSSSRSGSWIRSGPCRRADATRTTGTGRKPASPIPTRARARPATSRACSRRWTSITTRCPARSASSTSRSRTST
jgi:hemoglobin/transferrin/lactoferrin receptor protein